MSSAVAMGKASNYWRLAGMSYLKYSNICAAMVREATKKSSRAKFDETVHYKYFKWENGVRTKPVVVSNVEPPAH